ncbi:hypothetical protein AAF712_005904 [Marasmius tenuissimus]|uniref:Uncharacterized protein n=1 Tax=Marasmius tenuissimus TaxID=585030 RepID=A0ABR3A1A9_9AGAR|nr:hypothetical protein PM082_013751 [Marasmius tenuissimus]
MSLTTSCATSATLTSFTTITTTFPTTTFVENVVTGEPRTSAIGTTTTCLGFDTPDLSAILQAPTCTSSSVITQFTTIPGGVRTTSSPVVETITGVSTRGTTLFGTTCTTITLGGGNNNGNNNGNGNGNGNSSGNNGNTGGNSSDGGNQNQGTPPVSGPPSTITSQSETTLANGQVSTVVKTITTNMPNSPAVTSPSSTPDTQQNDDRSGDTSESLGPIIGGTVGGFFGLLFIALAIWLFINRRRKRWDDVFDKTTEEYGRMGDPGTSMASSGKSRGRFSLGQDLEDEPAPGPRPYHYGLIGQSLSSKNNNANTTMQQSNTSPPPMMSRPSTAASSYPLMGHHASASSSSHPQTPLYSNATGAPTPSSWLPATATTTTFPAADEPQADGYFGPRAGSPVSFNEGRRLQVTNASPPSIYGDQSLHQRMMSDDSVPSTPMDTPLTRSAINVAATGADPAMGRESSVKGRKSSLPPPENRGVLVSEDGPPKLILNL